MTAKASGHGPRDDRSRGKRLTSGMRHTHVDLTGLDTIKGDSVGLFLWSDHLPLRGVAALIDWRLCGKLSCAVQSQVFAGHRDETMLVPVTGRFGPRRLFIFGLGPKATWDVALLEAACGRAIDVMRRAGATQVVLGAPATSSDVGVERAFVKMASGELASQIDLLLTEKA